MNLNRNRFNEDGKTFCCAWDGYATDTRMMSNDVFYDTAAQSVFRQTFVMVVQ